MRSAAKRRPSSHDRCRRSAACSICAIPFPALTHWAIQMTRLRRGIGDVSEVRRRRHSGDYAEEAGSPSTRFERRLHALMRDHSASVGQTGQDVLTLEPGISPHDLLRRITGCEHRQDVLDRESSPANDRLPAEDCRVYGDPLQQVVFAHRSDHNNFGLAQPSATRPSATRPGTYLRVAVRRIGPVVTAPFWLVCRGSFAVLRSSHPPCLPGAAAVQDDRCVVRGGLRQATPVDHGCRPSLPTKLGTWLRIAVSEGWTCGDTHRRGCCAGDPSPSSAPHTARPPRGCGGSG
jgi:hypothetical protein